MTKLTLRQNFLLKRKNHPQKEKLKKNKNITKKLEKLQIFKDAKNIFCYISLPEEVQTKDLIKKYLKEKNIIVPKVEKRKIQLHHLKNFSDLKKGQFNILEPTKSCEVNPKEIDLVIVPGVSFDQQRNRLGFGKGCYDKILKKIPGPKIGLAYAFQITKKLPVDEHDMAMDMIVTEKRVYKNPQ